jgi:hypothetical protein
VGTSYTTGLEIIRIIDRYILGYIRSIVLCAFLIQHSSDLEASEQILTEETFI